MNSSSQAFTASVLGCSVLREERGACHKPLPVYTERGGLFLQPKKTGLIKANTAVHGTEEGFYSFFYLLHHSATDLVSSARCVVERTLGKLQNRN